MLKVNGKSGVASSGQGYIGPISFSACFLLESAAVDQLGSKHGTG